MLLPRSIIGRLSLLGAVTLSLGMLGASCGGDGGGDTASTSGPKGPVEITFDGQTDLFPSLKYSTGLLPGGSPVQASFTVSAKGSQKVHAVASPGGTQDAPTLTGLPGKGSLTLDGGFALIGELKVDLSGLPSYDGPIPGLDNVEIPIKGESAFDPFAIGKPVKVHADVPPSKLPGIPLPGAIPGVLVLEIAAGSTVDLTFTGTCAGVDGAQATYDGQVDRAGALVIQPSIEIQVPILGKKTFMIPSFTVDLALGGSKIEMSTPLGELGSEPAQGDHVKGSCKGSGTGGAGATSTGSTSATGVGGASATSTASSSATGAGGPDGGPDGGSTVCGTSHTFGDPALDACITNHCCQEFDTCNAGGAAACNDCISKGGGPLCNPFLLCAGPCVGAVCNSGLAFPGASYTDAQCLSTNCCVQFNACTMNNTQAQACADCFTAGGGPGTICEASLACAMTSCGL